MDISQSWQELAPRGVYPYSEPIESYLDRIRLNSAYERIPDEVFEQWIFPHHENEQTLQNYAWLDFRQLKFDISLWDIEQLSALNLVPQFDHMRRGYDSEFARLPDSEAPYWQAHGTWRVPPIVLDVETLPQTRPKTAALKGPYQLVEGHSRFHNLLISQFQHLYLAPLHRVYIMKSMNALKQ